MSNNNFAVPNGKVEDEVSDTANIPVEGDEADIAMPELLPPNPPQASDTPVYHPRPDHFLQHDNPLESHMDTTFQQPVTPDSPYPPLPPGVENYYQGMPTPEQKRNNWQGIVSTVLSGVSVMFSFFLGIFVIPMAIAGVVFGHMGLHSAKRGTANNRAQALTGTIIGYCLIGALILLVVGVIIIMILFSNSASPV